MCPYQQEIQKKKKKGKIKNKGVVMLIVKDFFWG